MRYQMGFTLIEFVVSLGLGLFLVSLLLTLYVDAKVVYQRTQSLVHMQERGRVALEWLSRDIRLAGFIGCPRLTEVPLTDTTDFTAANSLVGWHQGRSTATVVLPFSLQIGDSDVLLIQAADPHMVPIQAASGRHIYFDYLPPFVPGDRLIIADCRQAESIYFGRFRLHHRYQKGAEVAHWRKIIYYVAGTTRKNQAGQAIYALYRRDLNAPASKPIELVEGVEKLTFRYGLKRTSIEYVLADAVSDWRQVRSVQIALQLVSLENLAIGFNDYLFAGKRWAAQDRRLHQQWKQIITLRERAG